MNASRGLDTSRSSSVASGAPSAVGVLGGGRMGAGIAHAFLLAGSRVTVVERDADAAAAASTRVLESVAASVDRGTADEGAEVIAARFGTSTDVASFAGCGLVVEAVPEQLELKIDALTRVEAVLGDGAALASNTSSISIDELAALLDRPSRFLGMHFFNPVPASTLVEVVRGGATEAPLVDEARDWVAAIGKTPIVVADAPGFASSRLGVALGLEAIRMLEEGVASAEDIDRAMTLGYKHPVGPLRLTDLVGLDVRLGIAEYLATNLGERFAPPALLRRMVAEGSLGRKTGQGFYTWDAS
ncbi:3-hydroxyacyl-CoA dehydrogenase family protein [Agromyces salentinus]|uniref:3-hydroxyacyl-CoA dehydrogenase family protein n=1 Tax=Agromyces salentinus TaxID=269421 RepID=A0ABP4YZR2_9MICO|nr:3-hydroxyacyl-CoA dehydrogenase family protein [Agromyces salentinus]